MTTLRVDARALRDALRYLRPVMKQKRKNMVPVLNMVRCEIATGYMALTATDLDMSVTVEVECDADGKAAFLMPAASMRAAISKAAGAVTLTLERTGQDAFLTVKDDGFQVRIRLLIPVEDWPAWVQRDWSEPVTINEGELAKALRHVRPAVSAEETRFYLNGMFFAPSRLGAADTLALVATDGHFLSRYETGVPWKRHDLIVPAKTLDVISAALRPGGNREVKIQTAEVKISVTLDGTRIDAKTIDGTFPDYTRVTPNIEGEPAIRANMASGAVSRLLAMCRSPEHSTALKVEPGIGRMTYRNVFDGTEATAPVSGQGKAFGMNARILMNFLRQHPEIRISANGEMEAFAVATENPAATGVIMPMRV